VHSAARTNNALAAARPDSESAAAQYADWGQTLEYNVQYSAPADADLVFNGKIARVMNTATLFGASDGAIAALAYERDLLTFIRHISLRNALHRLVKLVQARGRNADPVVRQKIAELWIGEQALALNGYRSLTKILKGGAPGPEGSTSKLFWSQLDQDLAEVATEVIGPYSQLKAGSAMAPDDGEWEFYCLLARGSGIRAGTTEILRNILGERVLGLPKD